MLFSTDQNTKLRQVWRKSREATQRTGNLPRKASVIVHHWVWNVGGRHRTPEHEGPRALWLPRPQGLEKSTCSQGAPASSPPSCASSRIRLHSLTSHCLLPSLQKRSPSRKPEHSLSGYPEKDATVKSTDRLVL